LVKKKSGDSFLFIRQIAVFVARAAFLFILFLMLFWDIFGIFPHF